MRAPPVARNPLRRLYGSCYNTFVTFGAATLTDEVVQAASGGSTVECERVAQALAPQVRLMVMARLSPTPAQFHAVEDVTQAALTSLTAGLERLNHQTVPGLRAFVSTIVARRVADHLRARRPVAVAGGRIRSLDSSVGDYSDAGMLWQFLSASGTSPPSAAERADELRLVMEELGHLKPEHREVVTFAFFDQLPTSEIATRLDISRPAASMLLIRAVKTLRRNITGSSQVGGGDTHGV